MSAKRFRWVIDEYLPAQLAAGANANGGPIFQWGIVRCEAAGSACPADELVQFGQWSGSRESLEGWLEQLVELWEMGPGPIQGAWIFGMHGEEVAA